MPPTTPEHTKRLNFIRAFHTARTLVATALDQETRTQFLTHAPQQAFRTLASAACIIIAILYSTSAPDMDPNEANMIAQQASAAVHRCSVQEGDLPHRVGVIIETFWSFKHLLPRIEVGPRTWPGRLNVGVTYWCLDVFKNSLHKAQKSSEANGRRSSRAQEGTGMFPSLFSSINHLKNTCEFLFQLTQNSENRSKQQRTSRHIDYTITAHKSTPTADPEPAGTAAVAFTTTTATTATTATTTANESRFRPVPGNRLVYVHG